MVLKSHDSRRHFHYATHIYFIDIIALSCGALPLVDLLHGDFFASGQPLYCFLDGDIYLRLSPSWFHSSAAHFAGFFNLWAAALMLDAR